MKKINDYILDIYKERFACKAYDPTRRVSDQDFRTLMEVARLSPSSFGFEPWKFLVLESQEIKEKIKPYSWGVAASIEGASHLVAILAMKAPKIRHDRDYIRYIIEEIQDFPLELREGRYNTFKNFQESDFKLLEYDELLHHWALRQCYIPLANMLSASAMLGISSTPMEGFDREKVEEIFLSRGLYRGQDYGLAAMVSFGYCSREPRTKTRRPMEEVWQWVRD